MLLDEPPRDAAVEAAYASSVAFAGYVMNLTRAWAWRPDVAAAFGAARELLGSTTCLSARDVAVINAVVASERDDAYCATAWGTRLAGQTSPATAAAVLAGDADDLDERGRALARFAALVARDPNAVRPDDIGELRRVGLDDRAIAEAAMFAAFRLAFTAYNDALGAVTDDQLLAEAPPEVRAAAALGRARRPPAAS